MELGSLAFAIIPCMESSLVRIIALCGIFAFAAILALAFGRHVVAALDSAFSKWRRLGFVGRIITAAMVVVATVEAQKGESEGVRSEIGDTHLMKSLYFSVLVIF